MMLRILFRASLTRASFLLCVVLAVQCAVVYYVSFRRAGTVPVRLEAIPAALGEWIALEDRRIPEDIIGRVAPDQYLQRMYRHLGPEATAADVFIAYFASLEYGNPHTPSDCLQGSGWVPLSSDTVTIPVSPTAKIVAIKYIAQKDQETLMVLFWFQNAFRTSPRESLARVQMLPDAFLHNRSDVALVRLAVGVNGTDGEAKLARLEDLAVRTHSDLAQTLSADRSDLETVPKRFPPD
jgi:EpsI family protein